MMQGPMGPGGGDPRRMMRGRPPLQAPPLRQPLQPPAPIQAPQGPMPPGMMPKDPASQKRVRARTRQAQPAQGPMGPGMGMGQPPVLMAPEAEGAYGGYGTPAPGGPSMGGGMEDAYALARRMAGAGLAPGELGAMAGPGAAAMVDRFSGMRGMGPGMGMGMGMAGAGMGGAAGAAMPPGEAQRLEAMRRMRANGMMPGGGGSPLAMALRQMTGR